MSKCFDPDDCQLPGEPGHAPKPDHVRHQVKHAFIELHYAMDKLHSGDPAESGLLEAYATLDDLLEFLSREGTRTIGPDDDWGVNWTNHP